MGSAKKKSEAVQDEIRVLVVDDHPIFRLGVCERIRLIGGQVVLVGEGKNGFEAQTLTGTLSPHIVLMDLNMPGMSGIEATKVIKSEFPDVHIIIISAEEDIRDINSALQAGASGYLLKSVSGLELQEALFTVLAGGSALSPSVAKSLITALRQPTQTAADLSAREIQILEMLSTGSTNKHIGEELFLSTRTVEAHVRKIFQKLGVASRTEAVTTAMHRKLIGHKD
ncbi:MAG: response regulator transcription factor [Actinomycetota bacterium]